MNTQMIIDKLAKKANGSWFSVEWTSDLPLKAAWKKTGHTAYKITKAQCRKGIEYKNLKDVKEKVANGYELTHELPFGEWMEGQEGLILTHKGADYVRLYFGPNKTHTTYYIDGKEYTWDELKASEMLQNSFFNRSHEKPACISVKAANIQAIW